MHSSINLKSISQKFTIYTLFNNIVYFMKSTFIKSRTIPIISISLFIIIIVLNSIQYAANDPQYLQSKLIISNQKFPNGTFNIGNILYFIYDLFSINSFLNNGIVYVLLYILSYLCLSLIEMNIGYISLLFLLFIDMIFQSFWLAFTTTICQNITEPIYLPKLKMCCGSFILFTALGFVLFITQNHINNIYYRGLVLFMMLSIWTGCIVNDNYDVFYTTSNTASQKTCSIFTWHAAYFFFGICCGFVLGNKKNNNNNDNYNDNDNKNKNKNKNNNINCNITILDNYILV